MKVILDCNVLISAGFKKGTCRKLFNEIIQNHKCFVSQKMIEEFLGVKKRPRFKRIEQELDIIIQHLLQVAILVDPPPCPFPLPDPDDMIYLATALSIKADVLITGNKKHFPLQKYNQVFILSPREFLNRFKHKK